MDLHSRPVTWTGRGLRLAYAGNIVLAATALLYLVTSSGRLAATGFVVAGVFGLFSIQRMWMGRNEFEPPHGKHVKRGLILFSIAAFLFVYALLAGLTNVIETLSFRNMYPPLLGLVLAFATETASGSYLLYELVGAKRKPATLAYAVVGAIEATLLFVVGIQKIRVYETAQLRDANIAQDRLMMFLGEFLPFVMAGFLISRLWALFLLRHARKEVETAEHDAMQAEMPPSIEATKPPT